MNAYPSIHYIEEGCDEMLEFTDLLGTRVELAFDWRQQTIPPRHVLLLLRHEGCWLVTKHQTRGIEFPGGKAEEGETIEEAVIREAYEETGVTIHEIHQFAQYVVHSEKPFCKAVFTAAVKSIDEEAPTYETDGAVWMTAAQLDACKTLSFHMQDEGMRALREWVEMYEKKRVD